MSDRLEQALEQELADLLRNHDPEQPVNLDGDFALSDEQQEACVRLESLCTPPPPGRGIVTVNDQAWAIQFHKACLGLSLAIIQMGGGILLTFAGIIQAILFLSSCVHRLNRAEVFLIALLADNPEKKLDQKTLKADFLKKGRTELGDVELIFDRAVDHLIELNVVTLRNPYLCLAHTVLSLPELKMVPRRK
jgi:hypothetical protein